VFFFFEDDIFFICSVNTPNTNVSLKSEDAHSLETMTFNALYFAAFSNTS